MDASSELILDHNLYKLYPFKFKLLLTGCCYFLFINYGVFYIMPTISLIDLTYLMDTSLAVSSNGITLRGVAYCVGSILCGLLFRVFDRRIGLMIDMLLGALCLMVHPFLTSVPLFFVSMFVQGLVSASIDVATNSWILDLWGEECNFYMQALHFCFGLGMSVAPMCISPLLGLEPKPKNETSNVTTLEPDTFELGRASMLTAKSLDAFQTAFVAASIIMLVSMTIQVVIFVAENMKMKQLRSKARDGQQRMMSSMTKETDSAEQSSKPVNSRSVLVIGAFILFVYVGMEVNSMNFVTEYVHFLDYDVETAANQSTLLNTAFALFRFIGIFLSRFLSTDKMALIHLAMIATSSLILLFLSQTSLLWITVGFFLFGAGCSVIFPCVYSMIEERTRLSNLSVGILMFAGSIASFVYPMIVPLLLEAHPMLYVYNNVVSITIVITLIFVLIRKVPPSN